jgi:hypothetical protein
LNEEPVVLLKLIGALNVIPPSLLAESNISFSPYEKSDQTTYTLLLSKEIKRGSSESPLDASDAIGQNDDSSDKIKRNDKGVYPSKLEHLLRYDFCIYALPQFIP